LDAEHARPPVSHVDLQLERLERRGEPRPDLVDAGGEGACDDPVAVADLEVQAAYVHAADADLAAGGLLQRGRSRIGRGAADEQEEEKGDGSSHDASWGMGERRRCGRLRWGRYGCGNGA